METLRSADGSTLALDAPRQRAERARDLVYVVVLVGVFLWLAGRLWFVCDDAYITFRYSRHLADGQGLRYNIGPEAPVEGYSNFLWMLLAALARKTGLDIVIWMPRLSCACGVALVIWLYVVLRRRFACGPGVAALATASVAIFPPAAAWASSGLETMPFALALFATVERLVLRRAGPDWIGGALAGIVLLLIRVEGFAWCALVGLAAIFTAWRAGAAWRRPLRSWALAIGLVLTAFLLFRRLHFHRWISNTAHAKVILDADWAQTLACGGSYVAVFALTFLTPLAAVASALWLLSRMRHEPAAPAIVAMSFAPAAFAVVVGGDFMCMGRMLVPAFALQALALGVALRDLAAGGTLRRRAAATAGLALIALGLLPVASILPRGSGGDVLLVPPEVLRRFHFRLNAEEPLTEMEMWHVQQRHAEELAAVGRALALCVKPSESSVESAIGAIGYHCELFIFDRFGLVTQKVAELPVRKARKMSPGHDRLTSRDFFLDERPTYMDHELLSADKPRKIRETADSWDQRPGSAAYAPVLFRLPAQEGADPQVLLLHKRVPDGGDRGVMWSRFEQDVEALRARPRSK